MRAGDRVVGTARASPRPDAIARHGIALHRGSLRALGTGMAQGNLREERKEVSGRGREGDEFHVDIAAVRMRWGRYDARDGVDGTSEVCGETAGDGLRFTSVGCD